MKQIVEQVMAAMKNGTPASAPAAASSCGSKVTAANYPLAESMADQIKTPTGKDFTSLSYEKVINGNEGKFTIQVTVEGGAITDVQVIQGRVQLPGRVEDVEIEPTIIVRAVLRQRQPQGVDLRRLPVPLELRVKVLEGRPLVLVWTFLLEGVREDVAVFPIQKAQVAERGLVAV